MIEFLARVRDPMRPRPIDVVFAGDAPLKPAMRKRRLPGKSIVTRKVHPFS